MRHRLQPRVSIVGSGTCDAATAAVARELGARLAAMGCVVVCGGLGGVMEAACAGAGEAGGLTIGIVPGTDREAANAYVDVPLATGLGVMRNALVVANGDVVAAVAGGAGTLSEIAMALKTGKPVVAVGRYADLPGALPAKDAAEAAALIEGLLADATGQP